MSKRNNCKCGHSAKAHEINSWVTKDVEHGDCRECKCSLYEPAKDVLKEGE
jgi:hypothetical protein